MGQVENCAGFMLLKHGFDNGSQTTTQKGRAGALIVCNHNSGSNLKGEDTMLKWKYGMDFFLSGLIFHQCNILTKANVISYN